MNSQEEIAELKRELTKELDGKTLDSELASGIAQKFEESMLEFYKKGRSEAIKEELEFLLGEKEFMRKIKNWSIAYNFWETDKQQIEITLRIFKEKIKELKAKLKEVKE